MPAAPKASTKKPGAPKAKGAVRAKSGCYTCRIRRKKCDEQPNEEGHCQTCVRLRLECLGFGAKRPEWLRESRNVVELREKIKGFLAAQGMIKGHSGSGPRNAEHEPPMLRLNEDYSSSSESPPTPTLSLSSNDSHRPHHHGLNTSAIRDQGHAAWNLSMDSPYHHNGLHPSPVEIRHASPYTSSPGSFHNELLPSYNPPLNPSNSLVSLSLNSTSPAVTSTFGPLYYPPNFLEEDLNTSVDEDYATGMAYLGLNPNPEVDEYVHYYFKTVVDIQYLLADKSIPDMILETVLSHEFTRDAVHLLASVHCHRLHGPQSIVLDKPHHQFRYNSITPLLSQRHYSAEDAMAALQIVSTFLFDGGTGSWQAWLRVACVFADSILKDPRRKGPADALMHCDDRISFVIKTAIWFDVLASVTTQVPPHFLQVIRQIFDPNSAHIEGPSTSVPPKLSMMPVMGCENHIVWAMAETTTLAYWKQDQVRKGCLSMPSLVRRGSEIGYCLEPRQPVGSLHTDKELGRQFTSELFRTSTRVYLHSVVSGDWPSVPEIVNAVNDNITCLTSVPSGPGLDGLTRSIVRSTVFGLFMCGCLTEDQEQREFLLGHLRQQQSDNVGNCHAIETLMERIWQEREDTGKVNPVRWREYLKASKILLV